jgi:hypothetical protein
MTDINLAREAVKTFLYRFNDRAVFVDENISCPNILDRPNIKHYIKTIDDVNKISTYTEVVELLKLSYLEFIKSTPEKRDVHIFEYITKVYKNILELVSVCSL